MTPGSDSVFLVDRLREAALDTSPVEGLTHTLYRYPARFSPKFAADAIDAFSSPGDLVLDPFSGGATTIIEAITSGRHGVGTDINDLATFLGRAKTLRLTLDEEAELRWWADRIVPRFRYHQRLKNGNLPPGAQKNLSGPRPRVIRKLVGLALENLPEAWSPNIPIAARAAILSTAQWALDGRQCIPDSSAFRTRLSGTVHSMLEALAELRELRDTARPGGSAQFATVDALELDKVHPFRNGALADLVVTSPPYPGVHVLYHRWQIHGRRESPAPYWITASNDGHGASHYTIVARNNPADDLYFERLLPRMESIREVMKPSAMIVQLVGFSDPETQLPRYLEMMRAAGFTEQRKYATQRIWREVPGRRWHAVQRPAAPASREVVLLHTAE